jgi:DNA-binding Xre family transcriptional regulator
MLYFNLQNVLKVRGVTKPRVFLIKAGISAMSAHGLVRGSRKSMTLDIMEKLCKALYCQPNDLLRWTPDTMNPLPANHPLTQLQQSPAYEQMSKALRTMPLEKLEKVAEFIKENEKKAEE